MKNLILALLLGATPFYAQNPQIPVTGTLGSNGSSYPAICTTTVTFPSDANYTPTYPATACSSGVMVVRSTGSLTATRNLILPLTQGFNWKLENLTTGGQSIQVIGSSGVGVTIANGTAMSVMADGSNYVSAGGTGGGAVLPSSAVVYGLSSTTSRPATSADIGPLWNDSSCTSSPFMKKDGTCASSTATPGGSNTQIQRNGSGSFSADGNFTYDPSPSVRSVAIGGQNQLLMGQVISDPGYNFGNGIGTSTGSMTTSVVNFGSNIFGQGNHSFFNGTGLFCNGNGDCNPLVFNGGFNGASVAASDQGLTVYSDQMGISPLNAYTATVSSTGTPSGFPGVTLFTSGATGSYGVGRWLIDKTTGVASVTAGSPTTLGSGSNFYASLPVTGSTFTVSKQGALSAGVNGPATPNVNNTPILATFTVTIGSSCSAGDQFTIGGQNMESAKIASVTSYTGGVMTATAWLRSSHASGDFFMCEGPTGDLLVQNADTTLANGAKHVFIVLGAINSSTLAVAREGIAMMDSAFIGAGSDTIYQGARIVDARDPSSGAAGNGNMTLAETTATFNASDALEVPNGTSQNYTRFLVNGQNNNPYSKGNLFQINCIAGSFDCGDFDGGQFILAFSNANPTSFYTINGGRNTLKKFIGINGPIGTFAYWNTTPTGPGFEYQQTTGTSFNIWQADDADFFAELNNTGTVTTYLTHADNFTYAGKFGASANFNFTGYFKLPELSVAPSAVSGTDILYADSTSHCIKYSANGGSFSCLNTGGGSTSPGGSAGNLQYNSGGTSFGGDTNTNDDGAGNLTAVSYTATGPQGIAFTAGTAKSPAAGKAIFTVDASVGNGMLSENGGTASRVCTASNGVCGSGIANTTATTATTAVAANSCDASATTITLSGLTTSMTVNMTPTSDTTSVTGWGTPSSGLLYIVAWPSASNTVSYKRCNGTSSSITPGAVTWNVSAK